MATLPTEGRSPTRQNTKLESEGAEFLVMANLLIEGIFCYKAYVNFPGYDLIAVNPISQKVVRIQVKSRWATDYDKSFPIKNFNCDFVVHVALNRGYRFSKRNKVGDSGKKSPEFYILPISVVKAAQNVADKWGKVTITNIPDIEKYKDKWELISSFLN
jgi:PD-(D/E)XK endonuclease